MYKYNMNNVRVQKFKYVVYIECRIQNLRHSIYIECTYTILNIVDTRYNIEYSIQDLAIQDTIQEVRY